MIRETNKYEKSAVVGIRVSERAVELEEEVERCFTERADEF